MKEKFNPQEWLDKEDPKSNEKTAKETFKSKPVEFTDISSEVDKVVSRIEAAFTDIATSYADWLNVGFAFANEFGEAGRAFLKRVSRFYPGFTLDECNKQYDQCLKSQGHGITIRTFFHLAQQAGIEIGGMEHGARSGENDARSPGLLATASLPRPLTPSSPHSLSPSPPRVRRYP